MKVNARIKHHTITEDVDFTPAQSENLNQLSKYDLLPSEIGLNTFRKKAYANFNGEIKPLNSEDGTAILKDEDGNILDEKTVQAGEEVDIIAPNGTVVVKYEDDTPIDTVSVLSGGSEEVIVPNCTYWVVLTTESTSNINLTITTADSSQYVVDWGDGTITTHNSGVTATHSYTIPYKGVVRFKAVSGGLDNVYSIASTAGAWDFNLTLLGYQLPNMNGSVRFGGTQIRISGNIINVPRNLTGSLTLDGNQMSITGDLADLPQGLTQIIYLGGNSLTLTGNISNIPQGLTTTLYIRGNNVAISGTASQIPQGLNTTLHLEGNSISITGDTSDIPQGLIGILRLTGNSMNISGDLADLPQSLIGTMYITGNLFNLQGDIAQLPNIGALTIDCINSTCTYSSTRVWKDMSEVYIRLSTGHLTSTEIDNLFIDLDNSPLMSVAGTIDLRGNSAPPTSASLSARNSLVSKGKTLMYN